MILSLMFFDTCKGNRLYSFFFTKIQVPIYLWQMKRLLKCCIVSSYYFRDYLKKSSFALYLSNHDLSFLNRPILQAKIKFLSKKRF